MKVLYLCHTINSRHGGRTHAREFYAALNSVEDVASVDSFYELEQELPTSQSSEKRLTLTSWLPSAMHTFLRMTVMHRRRTEDVSRRLAAQSYDLLIVRHESTRIDFAELKRRHPTVKIAIEFNAILSDEYFENKIVRAIPRWLEFSQFRHVDKVFPVSSVLKQSLLDAGVDTDKIVVNPNGVDVRRFDSALLSRRAVLRQRYGIPEDSFVIGYLGGMEAFRRLPELIESYSLLANGDGKNKFFLFVVGDGQHSSVVKKELSRRCPQDSYLQLGWQDHQDVPQILATFDLAVMPYTLDYCSPLKLFEYMAMGLPTIGPNTPSVRELFSDEEQLWLVPQDVAGPEYLAKLMRRLADDSAYRSSVAKKGCHWVKENYTWHANAVRVVSAFQ
ncbi:MAG: glycosyltransferase family 4 protein [Gammaproteobacteria bacterium]|nr:glycosyltransferase family 4 protein [Gammaproteobacteria bacterium]